MSEERYKTLKISEFHIPELFSDCEPENGFMTKEGKSGEKITRLNPDVYKVVVKNLTVVVEIKTGFIVPSIFQYLLKLKMSGKEDIAFDARALRLYFDFLSANDLVWDVGSAQSYKRPVNRFSNYLYKAYHSGEIANSTSIAYFNAVMRFYKHYLSIAHPFKNSVPVKFKRSVIKKYANDLTSHISGLEIVMDVAECRPKIPSNNKVRLLRPLINSDSELFRQMLRLHGSLELKLMCLLAMTAGLRAEEIADLRVDMFDDYQGEKSYELRLGPEVGHTTKLNSQMPVIISGKVVQKIKKYLKSSRYLKRLKKESRDRPHVFYTQSGKAYDQKTISTLFGIFRGRYLQNILPSFDYKFHDLRATFGVLTLKAAFDSGLARADALAFTQTQMRHKNLAHTLAYLEHFETGIALEVQSDVNERLMEDLFNLSEDIL